MGFLLLIWASLSLFLKLDFEQVQIRRFGESRAAVAPRRAVLNPARTLLVLVKEKPSKRPQG